MAEWSRRYVQVVVYECRCGFESRIPLLDSMDSKNIGTKHIRWITSEASRQWHCK